MTLASLRALALAWCGVTFAAQAACPMPAELDAGNAAAEALFLARVLRPWAVGTPVRSRPDGFADAAAFGASGDGRADDTEGLQRALQEARKVWLAPRGVYRITRRLVLGSGAELASDGSATVLLAAGTGAFDNAAARRTEDAIYGERGTGLRLQGSGVALRDLFIVKEFEDERYVIGIDVRAASDVSIERVRLRGFSLAPGIITIRSSDGVRVAASLIHAACTASRHVPPDLPAFQISGFSIDDVRVQRRGSSGIVLEDNVIADLTMIPRTHRGTQTDGIDFGSPGIRSRSSVRHNHVSGVDEALDISASEVEAVGNHLEAGGIVVKLIHGARDVRVRANRIVATGRGPAVGLFRADEAPRQVRGIAIEGNRIRLSGTRSAAIEVDSDGPYPPLDVIVRDNAFEVSHCGQRALSCVHGACLTSPAPRRRIADGAPCLP